MNLNTGRVKFYLFLIFIVITIILLNIQQHFLSNVANERRLIVRWNRDDDVSCFFDYSDDCLPPMEDADIEGDSIFFHETSCSGGLNSRQACVIESAARLHPNRSIYVLFSASVSETIFQKSCLKQLRNLHVKFLRVHLPQYATGTGLENVLMKRIREAGKYTIEHASDILRVITLYKYGGVYLDTDALLVKRLDDLGKNWAIIESDTYISNAAMAIETHGIGHRVFKAVMEDIRDNYRPWEWSFNGPGAITRNFLKICVKGTQVANFTAERCKGFVVHQPTTFFPIPYPAYQLYLSPGKITSYNESHAFHLWNRLTSPHDIVAGSLLHDLAMKYCPTIFEYFGDNFGV